MLNIFWVGFFLISFFAAIYSSIFLGDFSVWTDITNAIFESSKLAFSICLNLTGILCFWLGVLKIAENSGFTKLLARFLYPLFRRIMPDIPENSPAIGSIVMNMAANMLGLDNAATPVGLKAMEQLQEHNSQKDVASNSQILFMVINSASVTIIPITILMYRIEMGSLNPTAVFIPILLATSLSTFVAFLTIAMIQRINIFNLVVMSYLLSFILVIGGLAYGFISLSPEDRVSISTNFANGLIFLIIVSFISYAVYKRIDAYESFITGAKEGFEVAIKIVPYLVAMLVAIAVFRASGVLDYVVFFFEKFFAFLGLNTDFVPALPTAIMKPLSGSGARAMMIETFSNYGVDSFPSFVASVIQGSTETTFYVLAVYFGAVRITKIRYALSVSLFADFVGVSFAIWFAYLFY